MRSVVAAINTLFCSKQSEEDDEESKHGDTSREVSSDTAYGRRLGDVANLCFPRLIEMLVQEQSMHFHRRRVIRTPHTKVRAAERDQISAFTRPARSPAGGDCRPAVQALVA